MKLSSKIAFGVVILAAAAGAVWYFGPWKKTTKQKQPEMTEIAVTRGMIKAMVRATGTVGPQNRLELKPPIGGRIDDVLVKEGDKVKAGQIVAWLSSTERAALLDAARARGDDEVAYWKNVYNATPVISPIDGEVIVRSVEPGQTIGADAAVVVISDRLIVKARIDETDIGKIRTNFAAEVALDAYPEVKAQGRVAHISYESKVINNVTIYETEIVCDKIPDVFRSGMSAEITVVRDEKADALLLPEDAVTREKEEWFVKVPDPADKEGRKLAVKVGLMDERNVEITEGLAEGDKVLQMKKAFSSSDLKGPEKNPFLPQLGGGGGRRGR